MLDGRKKNKTCPISSKQLLIYRICAHAYTRIIMSSFKRLTGFSCVNENQKDIYEKKKLSYTLEENKYK